VTAPYRVGLATLHGRHAHPLAWEIRTGWVWPRSRVVAPARFDDDDDDDDDDMVGGADG